MEDPDEEKVMNATEPQDRCSTALVPKLPSRLYIRAQRPWMALSPDKAKYNCQVSNFHLRIIIQDTLIGLPYLQIPAALNWFALIATFS